METDCCKISYQQTGYFSNIVIDYLNGNEQLQQFYKHTVSLQGITNAIAARQAFTTNRSLLVDELTKQYNGLALSSKQEQHLQSLLSNDTFTVTTAHQPNIFTGPLYFIYKIIHAIKLADELKTALPQYNFVPVYYMGSEDADLDELGYINVGGEKLVWQTKQTGAVGRMRVDKALIALIDSINGQAGIEKFGDELIAAFKDAYTLGKTIQQATLALVNDLFANFGLLILIPDNAALKTSFNHVVEKEINEQFSHQAVAATAVELSKHYKLQAAGRDLNLFYLIDDKRERIEVDGWQFKVDSLGLSWCKEEILHELHQHPERFSGNVILRGVYQETILPNIAFIGGGGELAYWLELKKVFEAVNVPYPMLILRNSFLLINEQHIAKAAKLGFTIADLFKEQQLLVNVLVKRDSEQQLNLSRELLQHKDLYNNMKTIVGNIDITLQQHVETLRIQSLKHLQELEKKMLRAEKRKFAAQQNQIAQLRNELFPNNSLQERVDNISLFYAKYGKDLLNKIYDASTGFNDGFGIVNL